MSALSDRMKRDLEIRGYAEKTRVMYLYHVRLFAKQGWLCSGRLPRTNIARLNNRHR